MSVTVTPTSENPTHHASLSDGTTTIGFNLCDGRGELNDLAIQRYPLERSAIKTTTGQSKYSDFDLPWMTIPQDDWSGGRGAEDYDEDTSRFYDNYRTQVLGDGIVLGGQATYGYNYRSMDQLSPASMTWGGLYAGTGENHRYRSATFVASASYSADKIECWVRANGSPGTLTAAIYSDSGGSPDALLGSASATFTTSSIEDTPSTKALFDFTGTQALTASTTYHVVIYGASTDDSTDYWQVGLVVSSAGGKYSSDGSSWSPDLDNDAPYFRITPTDTPARNKFFEYKYGLYAVKVLDSGGNSILYRNGDRGAADSNSGALSTLVDAAKTWTADEWIGGIVIITNGPGSEENQPWRTITDNDTTSLTVSPAWNITHTTSTEYVIIKTNKWTQVLDLGAVVTDFTVAGEFVYFARGESTNILRYQEYNAAATWTVRNTADVAAAVHLLAIHHPEDGITLYGSLNNHALYGTCVWRGSVPRTWEDLYNSLGTLVETNKPFDTRSVANVTQSSTGHATKIAIADAFATGIAATQDLAAAIDVTQGSKLGMVILSSVTTSAGDLELQLDDTADLGGTPVAYDIPALYTNQWTWVTMSMALTALSTPDGSAIASVGINVATDNGAQDVQIYGGVQILSANLLYTSLPKSSRINRLTAYGGNETDPRINPWVHTESLVYEIQTDNNGIAVPIPLGEIAALQSEENGTASAVNDVYLYFNLTRKLERYYARNLDDIGPDRELGMPSGRQGTPSMLVSYPGRVFMAYDAGASGTSSVLMAQGTSWQEVYRAPRAGLQIRDIYFQSIRGSNTGRLWISEGSDILWVPISLNPWNDSDFRYHHDGSLTMSYMYGGLQDVIKQWHSLKIFLDRNNSGYGTVTAEYRLDGDSAWTEITGTFDTVPVEEINLSSATPPDVRGRRLQVRLSLFTYDNRYTPKIKAAVLEAIAFVAAKYGYSMNAMLAEAESDIDLEGHEDTSFASVTAKATQLDTWLAEGRALTFRCVYAPFDNKTVYLDPQAMRPVRLQIGNATGDAHERHIIQLTVNTL